MLAPGGRFVLAGSGLTAAAAKASGTWPDTLGGTSVLFADIKAPVQSTAPGIYTNAADAVPPGGVVTLMLTGARLTNPAVNDGEASPADALAVPVARVSATIGSVDAAVAAAEMLPGEVGILRFRITVPAVSAGDQPAVVSIGGVVSNAVRIRVAPSL